MGIFGQPDNLKVESEMPRCYQNGLYSKRIGPCLSYRISNHWESDIWLLVRTSDIFEEQKSEQMNVYFKVRFLQLLIRHNSPVLPLPRCIPNKRVAVLCGDG